MPHAVRAPRGTTLSCKGWVQEAALRMLQNNLDPEVAEKPDELVVYGGSGKAARDWPSYERICACLHTLGDEETLLVQSGIRDDRTAEALARAGILVVQDRCLMVEYRAVKA